MTVNPPRPVAEGTLAQTPLAHVLVNVATRRLSGTLAVWPDPGEGSPRGQDRIRFERGMVVAMRPLTAVPSLDRGLGSLFGRRQAPYAFYEADLVGSGDGVLTGTADPYALIARALRGPKREEAIDSVLHRLANATIQLRADASLERFDFDGEERTIADSLRTPTTVGQVLAKSPDPDVARRVLYLLAITRAIGAASNAPQAGGASTATSPPRSVPERTKTPVPSESGPRQTSSNPPRSRRGGRAPSVPSMPPPPLDHLPPELGRRWMQIVDRAGDLEKQNYFEMLGIERSDGATAVRDAYFEQVKEWHPDRLPTELRPLKPWVERIFHYLTEARDTLSDPDLRAQYLKGVQAGGGTPATDRRVNAIVGAAMEFQKVEVFARRRSWDEALVTLAQAMKLNPEEADFHAMKAWLLLQQHGVETAEHVTTMLRNVDRALGLDDECVRAHYTKGLILKRLGKPQEALKHFQQVARLDPKHIEAAREVRLAEMRARTSHAPSSPEGRPSLLSKLFGGKKK